MVQILLILEVLFTQDFNVEDLFGGTLSGSELAFSSAIISSARVLSLFKMTFHVTLGD